MPGAHAVKPVDIGRPDIGLWLRRQAWWLLPETLVVALLAALIGSTWASPDRLHDQLTQRVVTILQQISPAEHHQHGHEVTAADKVICTVELFDMEPADATRMEQVQWAYAYYLCAAGQQGTAWDFAARISGPVAVSLTEPPVVRIAESGAGYPDRVRAIIPDHYEDRALAGFQDQDLPDNLRRRYTDEVERG